MIGYMKLPSAVRRFLSVFLLASLCAFFSYVAYYKRFEAHRVTLAHIELLERALSGYSQTDLLTMRRCGLEAKAWLKSCDLTGRSIIAELAEHSKSFKRFAHSPKDDVFDEETQSQYYFHAHRDAEHGHFHLFMWTDEMEGLGNPLFTSDQGGFVHLIAISTDAKGYPERLFTTNQWVTHEDWRCASEVQRLVKNFEIRHGKPSWPANRSLSAFVKLFIPQITQLLEERDERIKKESETRPLKEVLADRSLEVLSEIPVNIDAQLHAIEDRLDKSLL